MDNNTVKTENGIEVYTNPIYRAVDDYQVEKNIDDLSQISQGRWNSVLYYIHDCCFKDNKDILKLDNYSTGNLINGNSSNNNAYDTDKVNLVCDIYIRLCYEYDKEISVMGFNKMTGISLDTIYSWANESTQPGSSGSDVYKKLSSEREESLSAKLVTGKQNPVGLLGVLNRHYGWNMGQPRGQQDASKAKSIEQIQQQYSNIVPQIGDNTPPKADF